MRFQTLPPRGADSVSGFAAAMDDAIARVGLSGLIPRSSTLGFQLEGYGAIFIGAAGTPFALGSAALPRTPAPDIEGDPALTRAEIDRLSKRLAEIQATLDARAPSNEPEGLARLLALARFDASLGAIESRVTDLESRTGGAEGGQTGPDPIGGLERSLVELLLERGRTVAPQEGTLSLIVIVTPLSGPPSTADGAENRSVTVQVSIAAKDLAGGADADSIRRHVRIVRRRS